MPIFDLIQALTSKQAQIFSAYLNSYNDIRQMKNITDNLAVIAQCMLSEYNQGYSKCISHYLSNEIDKLILQLNHQTDLEIFYCSIIPLFPADYLKSPFFLSVWTYGPYIRLARLYSEKCVSAHIFNLQFCNHVCDNFVIMKDSIIILCEFDDYLHHFKSIRIDLAFVREANALISIGNEDAVELLDLMIYYADKTGSDCLDFVSLRIPLEFPDQDSGKKTRSVFSSLCNVPKLTPASFLFILYKRIKSGTIRQKVVLELAEQLKNGGIKEKIGVEMLFEFIKIDWCAVFEILNVYEVPRWYPPAIVNVIKEFGSDLLDDLCYSTESSSLCEEVSNCYDVESTSDMIDSDKNPLNASKNTTSMLISFDGVVPDSVCSQIMNSLKNIISDDCLVNSIIKLGSVQIRCYKSPHVLDCLLASVGDVRLYALLLFLNETWVLNNLNNILERFENKRDFLVLLWKKILYN